MRHRILLLAVLGFAALMPSCTKEKLISPGEGTTTFKISTRSLNEQDPDPDYRISTLRVIAFDKSSGNVRSNRLYSDAELTNNPISHTMYVGTYDFVFVGNEPASLTSALNGVVRASELSGVGFSIPASAFSSDPAVSIPMVLREDNVTVLADDVGVSIDGGVAQKPWNVVLQRIAILIEDIVLTSKSDLAGATITSVKFTNIPNSVPMMMGGSYPGGLTFGTSSTFGSFSSGAAVGEPEKNLYGIPAGNFAMRFAPPRIILPHNEFTPIGNADRALSMELVTSKGTFNYKVGLAPETDYTLPRNCKYRLVCTIDPSGLEVHLQATGWTDQNVNADPLNRLLNVSAESVTVYDRNPVRVYFYSNQNDIKLEGTGYDGTGNFVVNNMFYDLASGSNFVGSAGTGYMDMEYLGPAGNRTYTVYINAGGLRRAITVKTRITDPDDANCYMLAARGKRNIFFIPTTQVEKAATKANTITSSSDFTFTKSMFSSAVVLWQTWKATSTNNCLSVSKANDDYLRVVIPAGVDNGNNAVVALKNASGDVVWSWHLWITDYDPKNNINGTTHTYAGTAFQSGGMLYGKKMMDRNLGAMWTAADGLPIGSIMTTPGVTETTAVKAYGMLYQWGRKDPFIQAMNMSSELPIYGGEINSAALNVTVIGNSAAKNLLNAVRNPMTFYTSGGAATLDWYTNTTSNLEGNFWTSVGKSEFDPCPPGYRVPPVSLSSGTAAVDLANPWIGFNTNLADSYATCSNPFFAFYINGSVATPVYSSYDALKNPTAGSYYTSNGDANAAWYPMPGYRPYNSGILSYANVGKLGYYWTASNSKAVASGDNPYCAYDFCTQVAAYNYQVTLQVTGKANGLIVRCVSE